MTDATIQIAGKTLRANTCPKCSARVFPSVAFAEHVRRHEEIQTEITSWGKTVMRAGSGMVRGGPRQSGSKAAAIVKR